METDILSMSIYPSFQKKILYIHLSPKLFIPLANFDLHLFNQKVFFLIRNDTDISQKIIRPCTGGIIVGKKNSQIWFDVILAIWHHQFRATVSGVRVQKQESESPRGSENAEAREQESALISYQFCQSGSKIGFIHYINWMCTK